MILQANPSDLERAHEADECFPGLAGSALRTHLDRNQDLTDTGHRRLSFYLHDMDVRRLYQETGHSSTTHYAEKRLGLDRRRTGELLAVRRRLLTLPATDLALAKREISWSKVLLLVTVSTPEHEHEWLALAQRLSVRELALEVRLVRPGGAPRGPGERKGLAEIRFKEEASLDVLEHQKVELAKKKLAAEHGKAVGTRELLVMLSDLVLRLEQDGSVPGMTRVESSLYRVVLHAQEPIEPHEAHEGCCRDSTVLVDTDDGPVPFEHAEAQRCDALSFRLDDATNDPRAGEPQGPDPKTPDWMRRRVLARDGFRCRSCGTRFCLMVHHIRWRTRDRGPTRPSNLIVLCERCHGLVHALLLVLVGADADSIRFLDAEGNEVNGPGVEAISVPPPADPETAAPALVALDTLITLDTLPDAVDSTWWRRHEHLIRFGKAGLELEAGRPAAEEEATSENAAPAFDASVLRGSFSGLVGLEGLVDRFAAFAAGREAREKPFPHVLLTGPAGTGKTSIAHALAKGHGRRLVKATGPLLQDVSQLLRLLATLRAGDVFFVEEVHAAPRPVIETLYEAMAEGCVSLTLHAGNRERSLRLDLQAFTLVAATTEVGDLPRPFVDRFGIHESLGHYAAEDLTTLVTQRARGEGFRVERDAAGLLAECARGIPREALRLLDRALDDVAAAGRPALDSRAGRPALVVGEAAGRPAPSGGLMSASEIPPDVRQADASAGRPALDLPGARATLRRLGIDEAGLRPLERRYLGLLQRTARAIPLARLCALLGESARTILRDVEPWLFRLGLVAMTPFGRKASLGPRLAEAAM